MPYYREHFVNRSVPQKGPTGSAKTTNTEEVVMTSFRNSPHSLARTSNEVPDYLADPYAYFITSSEERKYHAQLEARGLSDHGGPDRGHTLSLKRHVIGGTRWSGSLSGRPFKDVFMGIDSSRSFGPHDGTWRSPSTPPTGMQAFGQQAYSRTAPTTVVFDAARFVGELREGIPSISMQAFKSTAEFFRNVGSGYLQAKFGWEPFVADLKSATKALQIATSNLAIKNGERVHRRYRLPPVESSETYEDAGTANIIMVYENPLQEFNQTLSQESAWFSAKYRLQRTRKVERWFEGEFTNYLPLNFNPNDFNSRASVLINTKLTPDTLWQLSPWSWLAEWFLRIEDSIRSNELVANDKLIMHYGYAMQRTTDMWSSTYYEGQDSFNSLQYYSNRPPLGGMLFSRTEHKERFRANPYGFTSGGYTGLTGSQASILGALALSQGLK